MTNFRFKSSETVSLEPFVPNKPSDSEMRLCCYLLIKSSRISSCGIANWPISTRSPTGSTLPAASSSSPHGNPFLRRTDNQLRCGAELRTNLQRSSAKRGPTGTSRRFRPCITSCSSAWCTAASGTSSLRLRRGKRRRVSTSQRS